jgi:hypothetical protein
MAVMLGASPSPTPQRLAAPSAPRSTVKGRDRRHARRRFDGFVVIVGLATRSRFAHIESMEQAQPPAGWFVNVKTFDAEDTPVIVRHFYVAEPDRKRAEEIAAELGETAETIHPLSQRDLGRELTSARPDGSRVSAVG